MLIFLLADTASFAQCSFAAANCQANMPNGTNSNFSALTWTHNSGPACPVGGDTSYSGSLLVTMGNNTNLTISSNFTVNGDFQIITSGSSSSLIIPAGVTLTVTGNLGDCTNNNMDFVVNGTLIVGGYISGKNNNDFSGSGSITATGGLYFTGGAPPTCVACAINWNVGSCVPAGTFCTLPVSLLFFKGIILNKEAHLTWSTETEKNCDFFTIEKSVDGINFEQVAHVKGQGNSFARANYEFNDRDLLIGKSYYRLTETDFDEQVFYFNIVAIDYSNTKSLLVYPVPVKDGLLNLKLNFKSELESRITITDVLGTVLIEANSWQQNMSVPIQLKAGIYFVRVTNGDFSAARRFVVN